LVELLVVLAIISVMAALLLPALRGAKSRAGLARCSNNLRQIQAAWQMYASDNQDWTVWPGADGRAAIYGPNWPIWVQGTMSYQPNQEENFNTTYLVDARYASLAHYIQNPALYKCPGDRSTALWHGAPRTRMRSYS
jgi:type II secretory pathway pseudopilin PulG